LFNYAADIIISDKVMPLNIEDLPQAPPVNRPVNENKNARIVLGL